MRRLLAAVGAAALTLAIVAPIAPAAVPDGNKQKMQFWTLVNYDQNGHAHEQPDTAADGAQVWSNDEVVTVKVEFDSYSALGGVKSWDIRLVPVAGGAPSTCHENLIPDDNRYSDTAYLSCPWDTTRAVDRTLTSHSADVTDQGFKRNWEVADRGPSVNGKYEIQVTARSAGQACGLLTGCRADPAKEVQYELYQDVNAKRWRGVTVTNGVANPAGVSAAYDPASSRINVTWARNPEPDVSYTVEEKIGDGKWGSGAEVPGTATRYERVIEQPGTYQYRVRANRPFAPESSDFVAAQAVDIAHVAPPTTSGANSADGAPNGGDPGVFIPGDTPTTTGPGATRGSGPARPGPSASRSGPTAAFRPSGSAGRSTGTTTGMAGEAEGEEPDGGFSAVLPYDQPREGFAESEETEEAGPQTLAGGVVPKPRDTRQLLIFMAISLTLFVFAMQLTVLVRRSKPALASAGPEQYHDDFDDWLGGF